MSKHGSMLALASLICAGVALAQPSGAPAPATQPTANAQKVCKTVVSAELGTKPYEMCMTKAEWDAKEIADAQDANRMVCHYEEVPGTRLKSRKVCLTAAQWDDRRLRDRQETERIQMQTCVVGAGC